MAPLLSEPRAGSEQLSQRPYGHSLEVLEERAPWIRGRGVDQYIGWVHRGYVREHSDIAEASARVALGCTVREPSGRVLAVPLGALLGNDAEVLRGGVISAAERAARFPPDALSLCRTAREAFRGTPYQWGGVTPWGADCSGLVQTVFALHGIVFPRNAREQATAGEHVQEGIDELSPADLLFFSDRQDGCATHVAIALGERRVVHLALGRGGYAVESLDAGDDSYVVALRSRYRFARRLRLTQ